MSSKPRKIACTTCRERKVKCDRVKPRCGKCAQYNVQCCYSPAAKQGKDEVSSKLKALNDRISQAESALANQHGGLPQTMSMATSPEVFGNESLAPWPHMPQSQLATPVPDFGGFFPTDEFFPAGISQELNSSAISDFPPGGTANWTTTNTLGNDAVDLVSTSVTSSKGIEDGSISYGSYPLTIQPDGSKTDIDSGFFDGQREDWSPSYHSWTPDALSMADQDVDMKAIGQLRKAVDRHSLTQSDCRGVPQNVTDDLYQTYFNTLHKVFPMIDQKTFFSTISRSETSTELIGLKYAMWAYAAALSPSYSSMSKQFYLSAREFLERSEAESSSSVPTIIDLQISILLAFYELTQMLFTRAWMSISRVTWLAQMLELHHMDQKSSASGGVVSSRKSEEKRMTFWAAFSLGCFASVGIGWNTSSSLDHQEITTLMPIYEAGARRCSRLLTLGQASKLSATQVLSSYQGMILVSSLCSSCCSHVKQLRLEGIIEYSNYDFWAHHHQLDETFNHVSTYALAHLKPDVSQIEPNVLSLNIILQASIICLHQAAIVKAEKTGVPNKQLSRSQNLCFEATLEITKLMKLVGPAYLVKMTPFVPWAVFVALQFLIRRSYDQSDSSDTSSDEPMSPNSSSRDRSGTFSPVQDNDRSSFSERSHGTTTDARALDSMHLLFSALSNMKKSFPLAKVFQDQLQKEISRGKDIPKFVGLVNFPISRLATNGSQESDDDDDDDDDDE